MVTRADTLLRRAEKAGAVIATAESCTGGLVAGAITDAPGSSTIFDRAFVTYSNSAKVEMLGVSLQSLRAFGAVSEAVAREMAEGALLHSAATIAVATTGIAGPGGSENKPEGRVCFAIAPADKPTIATTIEFGALGRDAVRKASVDYALDLLIEHLS